MNEDIFKSIAKRIDGYQEQMIQMQTELTAIPALGPENGGEGEAKKAEYIKNWLNNLKVDQLLEVNAPDDRVPAGYRPNLLVKIKGKSQAKTIWLMSHIDIVPPGDKKLWDTEPYEVVEKDGKLYGRGVEDNQQGLVSSLFAIKALQAENIVPNYDIGLALVADEETGSEKGLGYVIETSPRLFGKDDLIVIPDAGNEDGTMIEVAEKSIYWMKFQVLGKQCHGSTPEAGINAHKAGANLIVKLNALYDIYNDSDPVFEPPISTFEPTQKEANVPNVNTIPGEDIFYFDCRILPQYKLQDVEKTVRKLADEIEAEFGVKVSFSSPQKEEAAPATPVDAPVVKALERAILAVHKKQAKSVGIGGGTVAAFFRRAGLSAAVWATLDELAHQPNEYCVIDNMLKDTKVFAHLFLQD